MKKLFILFALGSMSFVSADHNHQSNYQQTQHPNSPVDYAETSSDSQLQSSEKKFPQDTASNAQDREINAKIRDQLSYGWFSNGFETLVIRTANGVVIISGNVDKPEDMQQINDLIKNIEGVRSIENQMNVKNR